MAMMNKPPLCRCPEHPATHSRESMILVEEKEVKGYVTHYVWACTACRDVNRALAVQVIANPRFRDAIRQHPAMQEYKRARLVERDPTSGKIRYFR
jgi:Fe-S oxidoreductase